MTKAEFEFIRMIVLEGITDKHERSRVEAITFEQALMNERDGKPAFGFARSISEEEQEMIMQEIALPQSHTRH